MDHTLWCFCDTDLLTLGPVLCATRPGPSIMPSEPVDRQVSNINVFHELTHTFGENYMSSDLMYFGKLGSLSCKIQFMHAQRYADSSRGKALRVIPRGKHG